MGTRALTDWTPTGINGEYSKALPDIEARVRTITENGSDMIAGTINGSLAVGEYYFDYLNKTLYAKATDGTDVNNKSMRIYTYYNIFGTWATEAEMANNQLYTVAKPSGNIYARYIKIFIMKKGNPSFTNLKLEIHPELNSYPTSKILATSENSWSNTEINSYENAASEIWFRFDRFGMKANEKYCLCLKANGTFTADSHISWLKLDPIYDDGAPSDVNSIVLGSLRFAIIGTSA